MLVQVVVGLVGSCALSLPPEPSRLPSAAASVCGLPLCTLLQGCPSDTQPEMPPEAVHI